MSPIPLLYLCVGASTLIAGGVLAQTASQPPVVAAPEVVVTSRRLTDARESIQPGLGATTYTVDQAAIQALPG
ncbi:hypothetical protein ABTL37_19170, partial [Acinetobacter baumannii]